MMTGASSSGGHEMQEGFATVAKAAKFLDMGKSTLYRLINDGVVDVRRFGANVRIPWSWLHDQARNRKAEQEADIVYETIRAKTRSANRAAEQSARECS
jgi:excisionase family DNA binding protein